MKAALGRMQGNGALRADADTEYLATGLMAALQGGYLLSQAAQGASPMRASPEFCAAAKPRGVLAPRPSGSPQAARDESATAGEASRRGVQVTRDRRPGTPGSVGHVHRHAGRARVRDRPLQRPPRRQQQRRPRVNASRRPPAAHSRAVTAVCAAAALAGVLAGCVSPAVDDTGYVGKAAATASTAVSAANTALLAVHGYQNGQLTSQALEVTLEQSEDDLSSAASTFDSVQPPDTPTSDSIRKRLDELLAPAQDALAGVRIAARRNDRRAMSAQQADLATATAALEDFTKAHPA